MYNIGDLIRERNEKGFRFMWIITDKRILHITTNISKVTYTIVNAENPSESFQYDENVMKKFFVKADNPHE